MSPLLSQPTIFGLTLWDPCVIPCSSVKQEGVQCTGNWSPKAYPTRDQHLVSTSGLSECARRVGDCRRREEGGLVRSGPHLHVQKGSLRTQGARQL